MGLERGPLSLVSTIEEIFEKKKKSSGLSLENRDYCRRGSAALTTLHPSNSKSWHYLYRQAAVAGSVEFVRGLRLRSLLVLF
jgi:hypothetical protein